MSGRFDVIFCRNVVIYFDEATQAKVWSRFVDKLAPGGTLCIGHSERLTGPAQNRFTNVGITTYRFTRGTGHEEEPRSRRRRFGQHAPAHLRGAQRSPRPRGRGSGRRPARSPPGDQGPEPRRRHARRRDAQHERPRLPREADAPPADAGHHGVEPDAARRRGDHAGAGDRRHRLRHQAVARRRAPFADLAEKVRMAAGARVQPRRPRSQPRRPGNPVPMPRTGASWRSGPLPAASRR